MTVVVAGARGYLGRHLLAKLQADDVAYRAIGRANAEGQFCDVEGGETATLHELLDGATAVVNLAGELVHDRSAGIRQYFDANVAFADDLTRAAVDQGAEVVVHASSRLVYPATLSGPAVEDEHAAPDTPYGLSKKWGEDATRVALGATRTSGISLRIGQVTGGDHPGLGVINSFIAQAKRDGVVKVNGGGVALRDFVHVDDVVGAVCAALEYRGPWTAVNVGGQVPLSIAGIADLVTATDPSGQARVEFVPVDAEDRSCYALDHERAESILGWKAGRSASDIVAEAWRASLPEC